LARVPHPLFPPHSNICRPFLQRNVPALPTVFTGPTFSKSFFPSPQWFFFSLLWLCTPIWISWPERLFQFFLQLTLLAQSFASFVLATALLFIAHVFFPPSRVIPVGFSLFPFNSLPSLLLRRFFCLHNPPKRPYGIPAFCPSFKEGSSIFFTPWPLVAHRQRPIALFPWLLLKSLTFSLSHHISFPFFPDCYCNSLISFLYLLVLRCSPSLSGVPAGLCCGVRSLSSY